MVTQRPAIKSYRDLEVYQNSYKASITVLTQILPRLPKEEQYDLADQLRRSVKAIPRLIAEGYAKKHQKRGFEKYLTDAMAEANETVVRILHLEMGISYCRDVYFRHIDSELCDTLIDTYDKTGRQLYRLAEAWRNFQKK